MLTVIRENGWRKLLMAGVLLLSPVPVLAQDTPPKTVGDITVATKWCQDKNDVSFQPDMNLLCIDAEFDVEGRLERDITSRHYRDDLVVVAKSPGGGLRTALNVTAFLEKFHYSIIVDGLCLSACAQFLFMGARYKIITGKGVVAMHGGPTPDKMIADMRTSKEGKASLLRENNDFREFYRSHGIDIAITTNAPLLLPKVWRAARRYSGRPSVPNSPGSASATSCSSMPPS